MRETLREWGVLVALACFLVGGLFYYSVGAKAGAEKVNSSVVAACERGIGKATIFENFANAAASARRSSAASEAAQGNKVEAQNDLNAAKEYELFAKQYAALTPLDCNASYPAP